MPRPVRERPHLPHLTTNQVSGVVQWSRSLVSAAASLFQELGFTVNRLISQADELGAHRFDSSDSSTLVQSSAGWQDLGVSVTINVPEGRNVMLQVFIAWQWQEPGADRLITFRCSQLNPEFSDGGGWFASHNTTTGAGSRRRTYSVLDVNPEAGDKTYTIDGGIGNDEFTVTFISLRAVVVP